MKKLALLLLFVSSIFAAQDSSVYAIIKRGDLSEKKRNMQIINVFDMAEQFPGFDFSTHWMGKCFVIIKIPRAQKDFYRSKIEKFNHETQTWSNENYLDMVEVAKKLKMPNLIDDMATKKLIPIINGDSIPEKDVKPFKGIPFENLVFDSMSVTVGNFTIGSGGDYANMTAFDSDLANMTGPVIAMYISAVAESGFNSITID